ncbi:Plasmodium exported protein, unknown function [Plasmodium sp. DRC-Itaito]|nr:Plasmodium exported protein, unknown function [Plasmodium sp. DRC-Itaito]
MIFLLKKKFSFPLVLCVLFLLFNNNIFKKWSNIRHNKNNGLILINRRCMAECITKESSKNILSRIGPLIQLKNYMTSSLKSDKKVDNNQNDLFKWNVIGLSYLPSVSAVIPGIGGEVTVSAHSNKITNDNNKYGSRSEDILNKSEVGIPSYMVETLKDIGPQVINGIIDKLMSENTEDLDYYPCTLAEFTALSVLFSLLPSLQLQLNETS